MPKDYLPVPHFKQSVDGQCLPACARMVLAYLGQKMEEAQVAKTLRSRSFGTPAPNIRYIESFGFSVMYGADVIISAPCLFAKRYPLHSIRSGWRITLL